MKKTLVEIVTALALVGGAETALAQFFVPPPPPIYVPSPTFDFCICPFPEQEYQEFYHSYPPCMQPRLCPPEDCDYIPPFFDRFKIEIKAIVNGVHEEVEPYLRGTGRNRKNYIDKLTKIILHQSGTGRLEK